MNRTARLVGAVALATASIAAYAVYHAVRPRRPLVATSCPCEDAPEPRVLVATPVGMVMVNECPSCGCREMLRDGGRVGRGGRR